MTPTQAEILKLVLAQRGIGLAGNKESFSYIRREGQSWVQVDGDTMTQQETETQISDDEVLRAVFWKARDRLGHYGPDDGKVSWEDVLDWLRDGGF